MVFSASDYNSKNTFWDIIENAGAPILYIWVEAYIHVQVTKSMTIRYSHVITIWHCKLQLQPLSVWRHLQMVLEMKYSDCPLTPFQWWSQLHFLSTLPLWCYSRLGAGCTILCLCQMKDSRPGCILPPSLPFQPFVFPRQWWYGWGCL